MEQRLVLAVCESGPYRFVRELVEHGARWLPWGYRASQMSEGIRDQVSPGTVVELWRVDDVRAPSTAHPLIAATIDHCMKTGEYVALTLWRLAEDPTDAGADQVIDGVRHGHLVFPIHGR